MVVGGTADAPTLGILDRDLAGVDLRDCGLHSPGLTAALGRHRRLDPRRRPDAVRRGDAQRRAQARPADRVARRRADAAAGDAVDGARGAGPLAPARRCCEALPALRVVTINVQPEHKAVLEGEREIVLTDDVDAADAAGDRGDAAAGPEVVLPDQHLRRRGALRAGPDVGRPRSTCARLGPLLRGRRLRAAPRRRRAARCSGSRCRPTRSRPRTATAAELGVARDSSPADATAYALGRAPAPDLVVVNPPRRGIGPELAGWLEPSGVRARRLLLVQRRVARARPRADAVAAAGRGAGARHVPAHDALRGAGAARAVISRGRTFGLRPLLVSLRLPRKASSP